MRFLGTLIAKKVGHFMILTHKIFAFCDVEFIEDHFPFSNISSSSDIPIPYLTAISNLPLEIHQLHLSSSLDQLSAALDGIDSPLVAR